MHNNLKKTIFVYKNNEFALISSQDNNKCFYASIVSLNTGKELLKTKCLFTTVLDIFNRICITLNDYRFL